MSTTHVAFSDDSSQGRYNSLALCTFSKEHEVELEAEIRELLKISSVEEFKWEKLRSAKYRFAAERIINFAFKHSDKMRVDVIIWDHEDSRHKLSQRDENENRVRMYYHLVSCVLSRRWTVDGSVWEWFPDEQSSVDWKTLWDCLRTKKHACVKDLFGENPDFERVVISKPAPASSANNPFIQIADLFAGLGAYSWGCFDRYELWIQSNEQKVQNSLFEQETPAPTFTDVEKERFSMIQLVRTKSGNARFQISLNSSRGFKSNRPDSPINFWLYSPQRPEDKAPTRGVA